MALNWCGPVSVNSSLSRHVPRVTMTESVYGHAAGYGLTEIAGQDNDGQPNLQGLTLQDRKMTDKLAGPDFAGQDNDGQTSRASHCNAGQTSQACILSELSK